MNIAHIHLWLTHVPILGSIFLLVLFVVALIARQVFVQQEIRAAGESLPIEQIHDGIGFVAQQAVQDALHSRPGSVNQQLGLVERSIRAIATGASCSSPPKSNTTRAHWLPASSTFTLEKNVREMRCSRARL